MIRSRARVGGRIGGPAPNIVASIALTLVIAACGSSKNSATPTTGAPTVAPAATPTNAPAGSPTPVDHGLVAELNAALLQPSDVSPDWHVAQNQNKVLDQRDVPGLTSGAKGAFVTLASPDKNEYVSQIAVVPDDGATAGLLEAFNSANYLGGLSAGAQDAKATPQTLPDAPPGAKALVFSGTATTGGAPQALNGEAVAFVHGRVLVIVIHGSFQPPKYPLNGGELASTVDSRLKTVEGIV